MIPASAKQKQAIAILTKNDAELKAAFVVQQTQDEAQHSTNDLTHAQANNIIMQLGGKPHYYDNWALFDNLDTRHAYIRSLCIQQDWYVMHTRNGRIADIGRLSEWLKHKAPVNKRLLDMNKAETSKIITALENMVLNYAKKAIAQ